MSNSPGKGDARRPTDEKKFRKNFDQIDWRHRTCPVCGYQNDHTAGACWHCDHEFENKV